MDPLTQKVQKEYQKLASGYDEDWHGYLKATHQPALELLVPKDSDRILDASAGTGIFAKYIRLLANPELTLIDISDEMLAIAQKELRETDRVIIKRMDVHSLDLPLDYFNKIITISSFHFYKDPERVINEFKKVLTQNGQIIIIDWDSEFWYFKIFLKVLKFTGRPLAKTFTLQEMIILLEEHGFSIVQKRRWNYWLWPLMGIKAVRRTKPADQ
ncbi:MAG: class I SAM-dependent methyltransferase [Balneolales bacterium]